MERTDRLLLSLLFGVAFAWRCEATVYYSDGSVVDTQALHNAARDGDTIILPAGTFSWASRLNITKGITLEGQTTINGAGTSNPSITDATIIQDNSPRNTSGSGVILVTLSPAQACRITGLTITHGTSNIFNSNGAVRLTTTGNAANTTMRVDHCHFDHLYDKCMASYGWCYGVMDHNVVHAQGNSQSYFCNSRPFSDQGDAAWNDFSWFGTGKFFFVEDNTFVGNGASSTSGCIDGDFGARMVIRHNDFTNAICLWHGTEGGAYRGTRAVEVYDNHFHWWVQASGGQQRSGNCLYHDNTFEGYQMGRVLAIVIYREMGASGVNGGELSQSDGTSPWDRNDTEGNGTYVEGHSPFLFESGAASSSASGGTLIDSTQNWTSNQWVGFSVSNINPNALCYLKGSYIISNTATAITYNFYASGDRGPDLVFNAGDRYQIHRVLTSLDQPGRGKGDLVLRNPIRNATTGAPWWTHEIVEPSMTWNNRYIPNNTAMGLSSSMPTVVANRDYHNLGAGFPPDTTPSLVSSTYTAAINGVAYVGTFVYPHPFTTNGTPSPTPTPTATITPTTTNSRRRQRDSDSSDSGDNSNCNSDVYSDSYGNGDSYIYSNSNSNSNSNGNGDVHPHTNTYSTRTTRSHHHYDR